jgi:hypothetical protein
MQQLSLHSAQLLALALKILHSNVTLPTDYFGPLEILIHSPLTPLKSLDLLMLLFLTHAMIPGYQTFSTLGYFKYGVCSFYLYHISYGSGVIQASIKMH